MRWPAWANHAVKIGGVTVYLGGLAVIAFLALLIALGVGTDVPDIVLQLEGFAP